MQRRRIKSRKTRAVKHVKTYGKIKKKIASHRPKKTSRPAHKKTPHKMHKKVHKKVHKKIIHHKRRKTTNAPYRKSHEKGMKHKKFHEKKYLSRRFCPKCGKVINHGTFCSNCDEPDFRFKDINLIICTDCRKYLYKSKWVKYRDIDTPIKNIAKDNMRAKVIIGKLSSHEKDKIHSHRAGVRTQVSLEARHGHKVYDIPARLEVTLCPACSKKGTKYFEGIIQLRNASPEALFFIKNDVHKMRRKGIYLTKEVHYSDKDSDLYITDQSYAKTIAVKTRKHFGGTIKKNAQLFSRDRLTAKDIYRLNILLELPPYYKGVIIKKDDGLYKVVSMDRKVHVVNLKTGKKKVIPHDTSYDVLKPATFQVIKRYPEYEVLDPNTYYQTRLMNPSGHKLEINQKVKVVVDGGEAWMI